LTPETSGSLYINEVFEMELLTSFAATVTEPASCSVRFQLLVDDILYYYSGGWVASDGTVAQGNTAAQIDTNKATLGVSINGSKVKVRAVLTGTVTATPTLSSVTLAYDYDAVEPTAPAKCYVHITLRDLIGVIFDGVTENAGAKFWCKAESPIGHTGQLIQSETQETTFNATGQAVLLLNETETPNKNVRFFVSYPESGSLRQIAFHPCVIPLAGSVNLLDITDPITDLS